MMAPKRETLHPAFGEAITFIFERARKRKGILSMVLPSRNDGVPIVCHFDTHDPRCVSALIGRIKSETEAAWHRSFPSKKRWTPVQCLGIANSVLRVDAGAAYALMTTWSGHVRELALRRVASVPGPFSLAMLVYRLNDWVEQVRKAAATVLETLDSSIAPDTIVGCMEMLLDFERVGRADPAAQQLVSNLMQRTTVLAMLRTEVLTGKADRTFRIFQRQIRTPVLDDILVTAATSSPHPRVRSSATRAILTQSNHWLGVAGRQERRVLVEADHESLSRKALTDHATAVQLAGLEYVVSKGKHWPDHESILLQFVTHPRNALAELAQWGLGVAGVDWINHLRSRLTEGCALNRNVARVLGKHGKSTDGDALWKIAAPQTDDRALLLLSASARLKTDAATVRLSSIALQSPDLRLARRAARALSEAGTHLLFDDLKLIAERGNEFFARGLDRHFNALGVMAQLTILATLERAGADFDVESWFSRPRRKINRGAFTITKEERTALASLLAEAPKTRERSHRLLAIPL